MMTRSLMVFYCLSNQLAVKVDRYYIVVTLRNNLFKGLQKTIHELYDIHLLLFVNGFRG